MIITLMVIIALLFIYRKYKEEDEGVPVKGFAFWILGCNRNSESNYKGFDNRVFVLKR